MKALFIALLTFVSLAAYAQEQTIDLVLAQPLVETNAVSELRVEIGDVIGIATSYVDESGDFGRRIQAGSLRVAMVGYEPPRGMGTYLSNIKDALEGEIRITGNEMDASAAAIGITGTWAGGTNELKTTIHAVMRKVADLTDQPEAWADAYYAALAEQILSQIGAP